MLGKSMLVMLLALLLAHVFLVFGMPLESAPGSSSSRCLNRPRDTAKVDSTPSTQPASSTAPNATTATAAPTGNDGGIRLLGRVDPTKKVLSWSGTGIEFTFQGTSATISMSNLSTVSSIVTLDIDGKLQPRIPVKPPSDGGGGIASISTGALSQGSHHVVVRKVDEARAGEFRIDGVKTDGTISATKPSTEGRLIEFIGDSITNAYGIYANESCHDGALGEDILSSYAVLTSNALKAEYSIIAVSGAGLLRNGGAIVAGDPTMRQYWARTVFSDQGTDTFAVPKDAAQVPNAVVIALGTNDFSTTIYSNSGASSKRDPVDQAALTKAYIDFIAVIRKQYGNCHIFLCTSPMLSDYWPSTEEKQYSALLKVLNEAASGDRADYVTVVEFATQDVNTKDLGCDYHPGFSEHKNMSLALTPVIQKAMKWS